jgi:predicted Kef-type K+ transport protein
MFKFLTALWKELDPVVELFIYLGIAYGISKLFGVSFLVGVAIVFSYFILSIIRLIVESFRK